MNLIDADALFKDLFVINGKVFPNIDIDNFPTTMEIKNIKKTIKNQPIIDAQPIVHAHWIDRDDGKYTKMINGIPQHECCCSNCKEWLVGSDEYAVNGMYCPKCGARMDEVGK